MPASHTGAPSAERLFGVDAINHDIQKAPNDEAEDKKDDPER